MTREELLHCCNADILSCNPKNLVDLKQVKIDEDLPVPMRMERYMDQISNPYLFRINDLVVKVTFSGTQDLSAALAGLVIRS